MLTPLPLFHFNAISVCVVGTLLVGGRASIERRFSVSNFWPEIERTGATMVSMLGSPAILIANAEDHRDQLGHQLRLCAAAPMPPDTDRLWQERFGCKTFNAGYGLTEASLISMLDAGEPNHPGAAGKPNDVDSTCRTSNSTSFGLPAAPGRFGSPSTSRSTRRLGEAVARAERLAPEACLPQTIGVGRHGRGCAQPQLVTQLVAMILGVSRRIAASRAC